MSTHTLARAVGALANGGDVRASVPEETWRDTTEVLLLVKQCPRLMEYADAALRSDRNFVTLCACHQPEVVAYASRELVSDVAFATRLIAQVPEALGHIPRALQRTVVLEAVTDAPQVVRVLPDELAGSLALATAIVSRNWKAYRYLGLWPRSDADLALLAVRADGRALVDAPFQLRDNRELVLEALRSFYFALHYADATLLSDEDFAIAALRVRPSVFHEIRDAHGDSWRVMSEAVRQGISLNYVPDALCNDARVVLEAVRSCPSSLRFASAEQRDSQGVVGAAIERDGRALQFASERLRADRETVGKAVRQCGVALEFASDALRADVEIVLSAVAQDALAGAHARPVDPALRILSSGHHTATTLRRRLLEMLEAEAQRHEILINVLGTSARLLPADLVIPVEETIARLACPGSLVAQRDKAAAFDHVFAGDTVVTDARHLVDRCIVGLSRPWPRRGARLRRKTIFHSGPRAPLITGLPLPEALLALYRDVDEEYYLGRIIFLSLPHVTRTVRDDLMMEVAIVDEDGEDVVWEYSPSRERMCERETGQELTFDHFLRLHA